MATPLGHSLAGYAVYCTSSRAQKRNALGLMLLCIAMANAPDLDFLPGMLVGQPALYHGAISHSLGFALLISVATAGVYRIMGNSFPAIFSVCFLSYVSHLVIDLFVPDGRWPFGIPVFWPISRQYFISPVPLFMGIHRADTTSGSTLEWVASMIHPHNLGVIALEILILLPFVFLAKRYRTGFLPSRQAHSDTR